MITKSVLRNVERFRLSWGWALLIILLAASNVWFYNAFPSRIRFALFGVLTLAVLLPLFPRPESWLYALPFVFFLLGSYRFPVGQFHPSIATLTMIAFLPFYMMERILWNKRMLVWAAPVSLCLVAVLLQCTSIAVSIHHHGQHQLNAIRDGSSIYLFLPMVFVIPVLCDTRVKLRRFLRTYLVVVLIVALSGVVEYFLLGGFARVDIGLGYIYRGRVSGFFRHHNVLAAYLELTTPLALAIFFKERDLRWRLVALATVLLGVLSTLYTFSRGGLIFLTVACALTLFWRLRKRIWVPLFIILLFVVLLFYTADVFERQMSLFTDLRSTLMEPTILHRFITYKGFVNQFLSSPLTGVGWGAKEFYWGRTKMYSFWEVRHTVSTAPILEFGGLNSMFLNQAVKGGMVSFTGVIIVIIAGFVALVKALRRNAGIVAIGLAAGILGFFGHQAVGNQMHWPMANAGFWISMGLLTTYAVREMKPTRSQQ
jgi:O-antigen ligase